MASLSVGLAPLRLVLRTPLSTAAGSHRRRDGLLVRIRAGRHVGWGEAMPLPGFGTETLPEAAAALQDASRWLEPFALPDGTAAIGRMLDGQALRGRPAARHAVESALLDLLGQDAGLPVSRLLAPGAAASVAVNALLPAEEPAALVAQAHAAVQDGYRHVKIKVGVGAVDRDVARVHALREALGAEIALRVDANGAWGGAAEANLRALAAANLELCEQPVAAADTDGLRRIRGQRICPIAADESAARPDAARDLLGPRPAVDLVVIRPMVLGGLLPALALARAAHARGVGCYVASSLDGVVARASATQLAAALPGTPRACGLAVGALFEGCEPDAYRPVRGRIPLPERPGLGLEEYRA